MAGSVRLGFGYTMLVLGLIYIVLMWAVLGIQFSASGGDGSVSGNVLQGSARGGDSDVTWSISVLLILFPGIALVIAGLPLVVFGHLAQKQQRAVDEAAPASAPPERS